MAKTKFAVGEYVTCVSLEDDVYDEYPQLKNALPISATIEDTDPECMADLVYRIKIKGHSKCDVWARECDVRVTTIGDLIKGQLDSSAEPNLDAPTSVTPEGRQQIANNLYKMVAELEEAIEAAEDEGFTVEYSPISLGLSFCAAPERY